MRTTGGTRSARPIPQAKARLFQADTGRKTVQALWIVEDCPVCSGVHRHNSPGLRISACGHLYRVIRAA